ncbi:MAG: hypothetical protein LBR17_07340 [Bacteroidales bacterium]|jgi:hypothetical protein|nr:hypothetical protein [Bacteroidales bacterium]
MGATNDNLRGSDANFDAFQVKLMNYFHEPSLPFPITDDELREGDKNQEKWAAAYAKCLDHETKTTVTVLEKNNARKTFVAWLSLMIDKYIWGNDEISDDQRRALGLTVKDTIPTPIPAPTSIPFMEINTQSPLEHNVTLWSNTAIGMKKRNQKKPKGVILALVRWDVSEVVPEVREDLKNVLLTGDVKFKLEFNYNQRGKKVYYTACWVNAKGETGDWCNLTEALIN